MRTILMEFKIEEYSREYIRMFNFFSAGTVTFSIGGDAESPAPGDSSSGNEPGAWNCVWKCRTATPVHLMSFSPDGTLFATTGFNDRLVKIWFENKQCKILTHVMKLNSVND